MSKPCCENCRFALPPDKYDWQFKCRRYPPTFSGGGSIQQVRNSYGGMEEGQFRVSGGIDDWPSVERDDWCGEYEKEVESE